MRVSYGAGYSGVVAQGSAVGIELLGFPISAAATTKSQIESQVFIFIIIIVHFIDFCCCRCNRWGIKLWTIDSESLFFISPLTLPV